MANKSDNDGDDDDDDDTMSCTRTYIELGRWNVWDSRLWNGCDVSFSKNAKIVFAQTTYDADKLLLPESMFYHSGLNINQSQSLNASSAKYR